MKYIPVLFIFLSCTLQTPTGTKEEVFTWIADNYVYKDDASEYWQSPEETLERGTGDCEDWAILCVYMLNEINIKANIALIQKPDWDPMVYHAAIWIDGRVYETRGGKDITDDYIVKQILSYDAMMFFRIFNT